MRVIKFFLIGLIFLVFICWAATIQFLCLLTGKASRMKAAAWNTHWLINVLCQIVGLKISIEGEKQFFAQRGFFIICPHVSYLDGLILGSCFPGIFVSKKEVQDWPVIGLVVALSQTVFINRQRRNQTPESLKKIIQALKNRINIFSFPEGTSTNGEQLRTFQSVFFQAPLESGSPILPVNIHYESVDSVSLKQFSRDEIYWYGDMPFFSHLWNILKFGEIKARVKIHPPIFPEIYRSTAGRKELAKICRDLLIEDTDHLKTQVDQEINAQLESRNRV